MTNYELFQMNFAYFDTKQDWQTWNQICGEVGKWWFMNCVVNE